ncbi:MAG: glycosyltransferase [Nanoarchaeota archaeon]
MKILYCDLNEESHSESYSISPKRYGGGRIFAAHAKEILNTNEDEFWLYSDKKSFEDITNLERKDRCIELSYEDKDRLRKGEPIKNIIKDVDKFDLIFHHHTSYFLNLEEIKAKQSCWSLGVQEIINPSFQYAIFYNSYQHPRITPNTNQLYAIIGKPIPDFKEYKKEDFIFQCTRHTSTFGSIQVASFCQKYNIEAYFAGPIDKGYPLLDYIDNIKTHYLGIIPEETKNEYYKRARISTFIHSWHTPFNLSAIESLSYGTPIMATDVGFWNSLITPKNGFLVRDEKSFVDAYNNSLELKQKDCWNTSAKYSVSNMISQFYKNFQIILAN